MVAIKKSSIVVLIALLLFHIVSNWYVVSNNRTPAPADAVQYLTSAFRIYDLLRQGQLFSTLETYNHPYSPLLIYLTQPLFFLFGRGIASATLINDVFLGILVASIFLLGKELFSEKTALLSAVIISFYPCIYGLSRAFMLDVPLTALICLQLYFLVKTKSFTHTRYSLLFGLSFGIADLVKPTSIVFMAGPVFIVFISGASLPDRARIRNMALAAAMALLVYSPWFIGRTDTILNHAVTTLTFTTGGGTLSPGPLLNLGGVMKMLVSDSLSYFFGILFIIATIHLLLDSSHPRLPKRILVSFMSPPYLFFTFVVHSKEPRFILPLTIGASLISSAFLLSIKRKVLRRGAVVLCVVVALAQFFVLCCAPQHLCPPSPLRNYFTRLWWYEGLYYPSQNSFGLDELFQLMGSDTSNDSRNISVTAAIVQCNGRLAYGQTCNDTHITLMRPKGFTALVYSPILRDTPHIRFCCWDGNPIVDSEPDYYLLISMPTPLPDSQEGISLDRSAFSSYALIGSIDVFTKSWWCITADEPHDHYYLYRKNT